MYTSRYGRHTKQGTKGRCDARKRASRYKEHVSFSGAVLHKSWFDLLFVYFLIVLKSTNEVSLLLDRDQAYRVISTGQLSACWHLHLQPIDVVVFHDPQGRPCFEGGFPLRCFQRLSFPNVATLLCRWRDNRSTSGSSTPVLSY